MLFFIKYFPFGGDEIFLKKNKEINQKSKFICFVFVFILLRIFSILRLSAIISFFNLSNNRWSFVTK